MGVAGEGRVLRGGSVDPECVVEEIGGDRFDIDTVINPKQMELWILRYHDGTSAY